MKSTHFLAVLALPLVACSSTTSATVQPAPNQASITIEEQGQPQRPSNAERVDVPSLRLEQGCAADARSLGLFQRFGLTGTCIGASSVESLPAVAGALVSQDKASLVGMCGTDEPKAFVMPRDTWLEVVASGTETVEFSGRMLEVELITCEVISAPEQRHVGKLVTIPVGWIQGRIVAE